jgi:hypothetical protein
MKSILLVPMLLIVMLSAGFQCVAQDYKHAVKIKGFPLGASYKWLTGFENGYEIAYHTLDNGRNITGLRVYNTPVLPRKSDRWFFSYGYGTHVSLYNSYSIYNPFKPFDPPRSYDKNFVSIGCDGYVGLEYRILKHPFFVSIDFIPNFEFFGPDYFRVNTDNFTVGMAYVF